jgi:hypothetical protein
MIEGVREIHGIVRPNRHIERLIQFRLLCRTFVAAVTLLARPG